MINREWVLKIANLAKLELKEGEIEIFQKQLSDILSFIDQLKKLDTENVEPYIQIIEAISMRDDEPHSSLDREKALMNAPEKDDGFFIVPRVVEV